MTAMHLRFLLERRWPPYLKWLGTCFTELPDASAVAPALRAAQAAVIWQERQAKLGEALSICCSPRSTTPLLRRLPSGSGQ